MRLARKVGMGFSQAPVWSRPARAPHWWKWVLGTCAADAASKSYVGGLDTNSATLTRR